MRGFSKVKSPTSSKPGKGKKEGPKVDFCTFKTKDDEIAKDFAFDVKEDYKKIMINHTFQIITLEVSKEYEHDFKLARAHATRKGKIIRKLNIDGKEEVKEKEFSA